MLKLRGQASVAAAELLLPVRQNANHFIGGVHLHQQVERLVLEHHNAVNLVGDRDLAAKLVGERAVRQRGEREKY